MSTWIAEFKTYESATGRRRPVVTHLFYGDTKTEALGVAAAHMKTDRFFSGCTNQGHFEDIGCWTEYRIYQV